MGLEVSKPVDPIKLPDYASYKVARELNRLHPVADSLLIQGRWRSVAYVQELEDNTHIEHCGISLVDHAGSWNKSSDRRFRQAFTRVAPQKII